MASHIDLARDTCENANKITAVLLFINFDTLVENVLHYLSFKHHKEFFL
jgi:hypothetical protein